MTVLMRFLSGLIVYVILVTVALAFIVGTLLLWYIWYSKKTSYDSEQIITDNPQPTLIFKSNVLFPESHNPLADSGNGTVLNNVDSGLKAGFISGGF